jgi:hypothetical protein
MLHLLPVGESQQASQPYAEAVSRLASIRHALRLVHPFGGGPASDCDEDAELAASWDDAGIERRRAFDLRTERMVGATAAGVEALLNERSAGREPHQEASKALVDQIRRELAEVSKLVLA